MVFKYATADEDGNLTTSYYEAVLKDSSVWDGNERGFEKDYERIEAPIRVEEGQVLDSIVGKYNLGGNGRNINNVGGTINYIEGNIDYNGRSIEGSTDRGGAIYNSFSSIPHGGIIKDIHANFNYNYASEEGGAIYNNYYGTIGSIVGDFVGNQATEGGAIWNMGVIENIKGDFIANMANGKGSAIYNARNDHHQGTNLIKNIEGNFIHNMGSAIYNDTEALIENVRANFIQNTTNAEVTDGGAIYNGGVIGNIVGDFINNSADNNGGAINNIGHIKNILGDFISNKAYGNGGAILNSSGKGSEGFISSSIEKISGNFINNEAVNGGAIYTHDTEISGNFVGNKATESGGAIFNATNENKNIKGNFVNNSAKFGGAINNSSYAKNNEYAANFIANKAILGGAIYNDHHTEIKKLNSNFIGNEAEQGGAIYNVDASNIKNIKGDFINNKANYYGGAIYNADKEGIHANSLDTYARIGNVEGNFIGNEANTGSAIYNAYYGIIGDITGNFIGNKGNFTIYNNAFGTDGDAEIGNIKGNFSNNTGTTIFNNGKMGNIEANFTGNKSNDDIIYNSAQGLGKIKGDFVGNEANVIINNYSIIKDIEGNFTNNKASTAIINNSQASQGLGNIKGNFIGNEADTIIYNNSRDTIKDITGTFKDNKVSTAVIHNVSINDTIGNITADFINNTGSAIYNGYYGIIGDITGRFENNQTTGHGGAINNYSPAENRLKDGNLGNIINSSFIGNSAAGKGGAIASNRNLNIIARDGKTSEFRGNYTYTTNEDGTVTTDDNAIYLIQKENVPYTEVNFTLENGGKIEMHDNIRGEGKYNVNIQGDSVNNTAFYMLNDMYGANLSVGNTTLNMLNGLAHTYTVDSLSLTNDINMLADVNLQTKEMDRITAQNYGEINGNINVIGLNIVKDAPKDQKVTAVYFADSELKDNVTSPVTEIPKAKAYTPIYQYDVKYDTTTDYGKGDGGYFVFTKGDEGGVNPNPSPDFNPAVLAAPVSKVAASQATVNEAFKYVFQHADSFTQIPAFERQARIHADKYAYGSTDFNHNLGALCPEHNNQSAWFKPYATFESIDLKNGPKVDTITYGSLAGFDTRFHEHKNGWASIGTGYVGYNGSQLKYHGVDTTMNGGLIGYTHTMYKNYFWTALTISAGAGVGETRTMYGKEDFTSLTAGVGSKTGYNFEFKEGKYILQPIMFMSYSFANTFDYTNAAGVKIKPGTAHSIQLNPSVRFIANTKNGWQPYASVGMVWNVLNQNGVKADNVKLPEMSMKPYVEYGLGVQRNWKDKFTAYGQAMVRNGGRSGIAFTAGFRWALGKDHSDYQNVKNNTKNASAKVLKKAQKHTDRLSNAVIDNISISSTAPSTTRTVLKQLPTAQKASLAAKSQNTTRTTSRAILKQI